MPQTRICGGFLLTHCDALKTDHPDTWRELEESNIFVTKSTIPFVSIGADHACEQLNRLMKVHAGITGISNNPNARQRFFLVTPELSCLAKDFKSQFHSAGSQAAVHHDLSPGKVKREHERPSPESKKPLRAIGIHLLLTAVPSTTLSRMHTSQMSMCHRSSTSMTMVRSSTKTIWQRRSMVMSVSGLL